MGSGEIEIWSDLKGEDFMKECFFSALHFVFYKGAAVWSYFLFCWIYKKVLKVSWKEILQVFCKKVLFMFYVLIPF